MSKIHYVLGGIPLEMLLTNARFMQYVGKGKNSQLTLITNLRRFPAAYFCIGVSHS